MMPELKPNDKGTLTDIDGRKRKVKRKRHILLPQSKPLNRNKRFILEELEIEKTEEKPEEKMLRFGYYIIGKKPRRKGKWVWAQFCPIIAVENFEKIVSRARSRGILPKRHHAQ
jgi:hypothetical protein